jgi:hypothetical protein
VSGAEPVALAANAGEPAASPGRALAGLSERLREQVEARPIAAAAASLVAGFALGGGVNRQLVTLILGIGARAAANRLQESIFERTPEAERAEEEPR